MKFSTYRCYLFYLHDTIRLKINKFEYKKQIVLKKILHFCSLFLIKLNGVVGYNSDYRIY